MGDVTVEGNKWFSKELIKKYIHSKKNQVLNLQHLLKDILRLNRNPDLELRTSLKAGKEDGASDLSLKVVEKLPYHIGASLDNQGTRLTGKYRTSVSFRSSNITGNNDLLFVNTLLSKWTVGEFVSYQLPIGTYGQKIGFEYAYFHSRLGEEYKPYKIFGDTFIYKPYISSEVYLSEDLQIDAEAGLSIKSIYRENLGSITTSEQERLPYFGFDVSKMDSFLGGGQWFFSPQFTFGTEHFLGATSSKSQKMGRAGSGGFFIKYSQSLNRYQRMPFDSFLQIRSTFQVASNTLPSSEQLQLGGANSVRGYPEGDYLCDNGINGNFDWIFPMYFIPKEIKLPMSKMTLRDSIRPVCFMDIGAGRVLKTMSGEEEKKFLMGLGGGLRINLYDKVSVRLEWAKDVGDKPISGQGPSTFYITVQSET